LIAMFLLIMPKCKLIMINYDIAIGVLKVCLDVSSVVQSAKLLFVPDKAQLPSILRSTPRLLLILFSTRLFTLVLSYLLYFIDKANNYTWSDWPFDINSLLNGFAFIGFYVLSIQMHLFVLITYRKLPSHFIPLSVIGIGSILGIFVVTDWVAVFKYLIPNALL